MESFRALIRHYKGLRRGFMPMIKLDISETTSEDYKIKLKKNNYRFWIAVILITFVLGDIAWHYYHTEKFDNHFLYNLSRIWPANSDQRNVISIGAYMILAWHYYPLLFERWVHTETLIFFDDEDQLNSSIYHKGKRFPRALSKILHNFLKIKTFFDWFVFVSCLNAHAVWTFPFFIGEIFFPDVETWSVRRTIFLVISPFLISYLCTVIIYPTAFWFNCRFIQLKQTYYIDWLEDAIKKGTKSNRKMKKVYPQYKSQFTEIFIMLKDIRILNTFWSKYNTGTILCYSMEVCYIFFTLVTAKTAIERYQLLPLMGFALAYFSYLYIISKHCSKIIQNNILLHRNIRIFLTRAMRSKSIHGKNIFKIYNQISFETFFRFTCFRLLNGLRINNRMFEFVFSSLVVFVLKLFGKQLVAYF